MPFQVLGPEYTAALQILRQTAATNTESESGAGAPTLLKEGEDLPEEVLSFAASSQMLGSLLAGTLPATQLALKISPRASKSHFPKSGNHFFFFNIPEIAQPELRDCVLVAAQTRMGITSYSGCWKSPK